MNGEPADPWRLLVLASLLLLAAVVIPRLRPRQPLWLRIVLAISIFVALTILVQKILGSPLWPHFTTAYPDEQFWEQLVEAGWWLLGARVAVAAARLLVVLEHRPRETQIISDLVAGAIYVVAILAIINFAFLVPIRGLLATSGVIAIVLGLALQSTMSDVFSGIAVGLERPYKAGDLIWVEGGIEGHVIQLNWRSTQIATGDNNIAVVPNSVIAKARLVNRSAPTPVSGGTFEVRLDAGASPGHCIATLTAAVRACRVPLAEPAPTVTCAALLGDGAVYEIGFSTASSAMLAAARTELASQLHRHLRHAGIALAVTGVATPPPVAPFTPGQLLEQSDLFGVIEAGQRDLLAQHFTAIWLQPGETLIREGDTPEALFVVASGTAEITRMTAGRPRVVYRMGPGESLGAIGLITGSPYAATATALTPLKAYRLDRHDIAAAIDAKPELAAGLEALAQRGMAALRREAATHEDAQLAHPEMFLSRLRSFLRVLRS